MNKNKLNTLDLIHLCIVYVLWGSTYLAIRIAVQDGSGFPPMIMSATRVFAGSLILLGIVKFFKKQSFYLTRNDTIVLAVSGLALWWVGHGLLTLAETKVDSGYAALIIACTPIWVSIIESRLDRKRPSLQLMISLFIGIAGIAVLNWPVISEGTIGDLRGAFMLIVAGLSWGAGSVYQKRSGIQSSPEMSSAIQQLFAGVALFFTSLIIQEPVINPSVSAWWAWGYLVIFGSVIAFTSFVKALTLLPPNVVFTYAYVNPVIAVILGYIILNEPVTRWTLGGATLVIIGVLGVFKDQQKTMSLSH